MKFSIFSVFIAFSLLFFPIFSVADLKNDEKINSLVTLAKKGDAEQFLQIVKNDNLLNQSDSDGHTAIFAAMFGQPELTNRLLSLGASLEHKDGLGFTPLISAALLGYPEAVDTLIRHGADIEAENADGQTALLMSVLSMSANNASTGFDDDDKIKWHNRWNKVIEILIKNGADVNATDKRGASPLFIAIFSNDVELCRYLIGVGANPNHKLNNGVSMLSFAKIGASKEIVNLLQTHIGN